jgi:acyl transferase domain-containing protein
MASVWAEVLRAPSVPLDTNFFDLGGHSLLAAELQAKIRERCKVDVRVTDLFLHPTVRALAAHVKRSHGVAERPARAAAPTTAAPAVPRLDAGPDGVAVIGMAGRFPGADGVEAFWENVVGGIESTTTFAARELEDARIPPEWLRHPRFVPVRGVCRSLVDFDPAAFKLTEREASLLDPQIRLLLECSVEALEDAAIDPLRAHRDHHLRIGIFAATSRSSYYLNHLLHCGDALRAFSPLQVSMSTDKSYAATQVAYRLSLVGPALSVDTACSSSLVALHLALRSLADGECDVALVGGASVDVPAAGGHVADEGGIGSPDGHCRPFDARANGTVKGSGGCVVVLRPLRDALAHGHKVYAAVRGSASNNDGSLKAGFTAPSAAGQEAVVREALRRSGVPATRIGYIETHGTGTAIGDAVEISALRRVFAAGSIAIGGVKANVGHLDAAAGITGFVKTVLAVERGVLPPQPGFSSPARELDLESTPFRVLKAPEDWTTRGEPRAAGVSSFGIGGTNVHVVVEEVLAPGHPEPEVPRAELVPISADSAASLQASMDRLRVALNDRPTLRLSDVALTLSAGRVERTHRVAVPAVSLAELCEGLRKATPRSAGNTAPTVVWLLPGQGVSYAGAAADLYRDNATFRDALDRCADVLAKHVDVDVRDVLCRSEEEVPAQVAARTDVAQPALTAYCLSFADALGAWGVLPDRLVGHSAGEIACACLAGVFERDDALRLAAIRGRLMADTPSGAMAAVGLGSSDIERWVAEGCELAVINGKDHCVLAGPSVAVLATLERMRAAGVAVRQLPVDRAFHSSLMSDAARAFEQEVARVTRGPAQRRFTSNLHGGWIGDEARDPVYWGDQLRRTALYAKQVETALEELDVLFLDASPRHSFQALVAGHPAYRGQPVLSSREPTAPYRAGQRALLGVVGELWSRGCAVDWAPRFDGKTASAARVRLPTYAFDRKRCWVDGAAPASAGGSAKAGDLVNGHGTAGASAVASSAAPPEATNGGPPPVAEAVTAIWRNILEDRNFELDDNFFSAGGSSLTAAQMLNEIERAYGRRPPLQPFFATPTVRWIVSWLEGQSIDEAPRSPARELVDL